MIAQTIHLLFLAYTIMLLARILGSWFPSFARSKYMYVIAQYTDPYLNVFRKLIPPIGGTFDLSPILGFFALRIAEYFIMSLLR